MERSQYYYGELVNCKVNGKWDSARIAVLSSESLNSRERDSFQNAVDKISGEKQIDMSKIVRMAESVFCKQRVNA